MPSAIKQAGYALAALWIFGGAAVYYWRFTAQFYAAHREAIFDLAERLSQLI